MNTLSLFDGISCGRVALSRAGIKVGRYYASEIDKHAINISKHNHPDIVQLGSVKDWREWDIDWENINLLLAGFPCQAWSVAGKAKGIEDPRGQLAHDLLDIKTHLETINPDIKFLFENVRMKKEFMMYLSALFGVEPILINSNLVSAQNRSRYFWTNIQGVAQPEDKGILLKDIVHEKVDEKYLHSEKAIAYLSRQVKGGRSHWDFKHHSDTRKDKSQCVTANIHKGVPYNVLIHDLNEYMVPFDKSLKILEKEVQRGKVGYFRKDSQANRVYFIHDKAVTLCGEAGGGAAKMGQYLFGVITPDRVNKRQNGQRFSEGSKFYTLTAQDKHGILIEGYIRKLTPVECERLQTLPDDYTKTLGVSQTQRYKALGNGWTVDVITHILKNLNHEGLGISRNDCDEQIKGFIQ